MCKLLINVLDQKLIVFLLFLWNIIATTYIFVNPFKLSSDRKPNHTADRYLFNLCRKFDQFDRLKKDDLSLPTTSTRNQQKHDEHRWDICKSIRLSKQMNQTSTVQLNKPIYRALNYCRFDAVSEQEFQVQFFRPSNSNCSLRAPSCVQLPPENYRWVDKHIVFRHRPISY